ncbi:UNVERIFIED_CONTAM: hypothetical protein HDU68_004533 [Siphonaria sp. JEL0065]|nr:hypothetical protein HDU68_004533 [Siphonaria sp. JEL0065]
MLKSLIAVTLLAFSSVLAAPATNNQPIPFTVAIDSPEGGFRCLTRFPAWPNPNPFPASYQLAAWSKEGELINCYQNSFIYNPVDNTISQAPGKNFTSKTYWYVDPKGTTNIIPQTSKPKNLQWVVSPFENNFARGNITANFLEKGKVVKSLVATVSNFGQYVLDTQDNYHARIIAF